MKNHKTIGTVRERERERVILREIGYICAKRVKGLTIQHNNK